MMVPRILAQPTATRRKPCTLAMAVGLFRPDAGMVLLGLALDGAGLWIPSTYEPKATPDRPAEAEATR
ncbi:hypothetical protein [Nonomuraea sp. NPDC048916]|uniref:hypothetical protein n=1 Tax=Nonomuraea sp. NPDC048916 TaxID=3154232 RepID=UPI003400BB2D